MSSSGSGEKEKQEKQRGQQRNRKPKKRTVAVETHTHTHSRVPHAMPPTEAHRGGQDKKAARSAEGSPSVGRTCICCAFFLLALPHTHTHTYIRSFSGQVSHRPAIKTHISTRAHRAGKQTKVPQASARPLGRSTKRYGVFASRETRRDTRNAQKRVRERFYSGMLPCFFHGLRSCLRDRRSRSSHTRMRVWLGSITASTNPFRAADSGVQKAFS